MPAEENATYVERGGLVVVHQGDKIVAAPGSEAALASAAGADVDYYFPVHVVMVGDIGEETKQEIEGRIWDALYAALG
jgi:hypothetical protein